MSTDASVTLDGEVIAPLQSRYLMLHKPLGTVCTARHADPRSVLNLLPDDQRKPLQCVGRLDVDTTGLLLVTDDGGWNHNISRPGCTAKVYRIELARPIDETALGALLEGVMLRNESRAARAQWVDRVDALTLRIAVLEGRYHLVRRMVAAVGNHVASLHREAVGDVVLDPALAPGQWRALSESERALWGIS